MAKIEKELVIANKKGLHARPAALFVQLVSKFDVNVTITYNGQQVNGKSIMGLLTLGAQSGTHLTVTVDGNDPDPAMQEFELFFSKQEEELMQ